MNPLNNSTREKIGYACVLIAHTCGWLSSVDPKIIERYIRHKRKLYTSTAPTKEHYDALKGKNAPQSSAIVAGLFFAIAICGLIGVVPLPPLFFLGSSMFFLMVTLISWLGIKTEKGVMAITVLQESRHER